MNQTSHYLLTGASGFLGKIFYDVLISNGCKVTKFIGDITAPISLDKNANFDTIVHAAGKAHIIPKTSDEKRIFYDVNFDGTKNLCHALELLSVKPRSFIFISTVAVYGADCGSMISENHSLNGKTPYAKSKILAEEWLKNWALKNNITLGILRLPLVAGKNPPGNLGDMIKAIKAGKYFSIGNANPKKSMVWGGDIPTIFLKLSEKGGIFNLTDGRHPSFKQIETIISKKANRKIKTIPMFGAKFLAFAGNVLGSRFPINSNKLTKIISDLTFNDEKARSELNWKPSSVLEKLSEVL
jgi:nucleoside-diphosphate-sugar epimerase